MKRGQIAIFMILGFVLIVSIGFVLYLTNIDKKPLLKSEVKIKIDAVSEKNSAEFFTQHCLNIVLNDALNELGENGGYIYRTPNLKIQYTEDNEFTLLYIDRNNFLASSDNIKADIEKYINENIRYCVDDFVIYEKQGWNVEIPKVNSNAMLADKEVITSLEFPVKFRRNELSFDLDKLIARKEISLKKILQEASNVLKDAEDAQREIDAHNIPDLPPQSFTRNGLLFLNYLYPNTGRLLWLIKEKEYEFFFAVNLET